MRLMKDIRTSSKNIWNHLDHYLPHLDIEEEEVVRSVKGLRDAKAKVRGLEDREMRKRRKKEARLQAQAQLTTSIADNDVVTAASGPARMTHGTIVQSAQLAIRARAKVTAPSVMITHRPFSITDPHPHTTSFDPSAVIRKQPATILQSSESGSDRIMTPPGSHNNKQVSPEWTKPYSSSSSRSHSRSYQGRESPKNGEGSSRLKLKGPGSVMPDEIARQLAEMLTSFQRIGMENRRVRTRDQSSLNSNVDIQSTTSAATTHVSRDAPSETSQDEDLVSRDVRGLDVSVFREDETQDSEMEDSDAEDVHSVEASWATGQLNVDDDTLVALSGDGGVSELIS